MNEEEKELIDGFFNKGWCCDLDEVYNAVMKLEDLYQKEKEKNKELEMQLLEKDLYIDGLKEDRRIAIKEIQEEYYISKDKIKEKIEELGKKEKEELKGTKGQDRYNIKQEFMFKKNILQELLEERKEKI